jgi:predicted CopG family antitoxin
VQSLRNQTEKKEPKKTLNIPVSIYEKLGRMGYTNETYGQVIDRLIKSASTNKGESQ